MVGASYQLLQCTCSSGGVHSTVSCSDRSTCASDGVRHTSSCRDRSTCAVVEYIVPALTVIAPALACGVPRNCGNRSTRISIGELRGCSRSQLLLQWWNTLCQSLSCLWRQFQSCSQRQRLWQCTSGQCLLSQRRPLQLCAQPAPSTAYIAMLVSADGAHCCCGSRDVAVSHSVTSVLTAETLRRHTLVCCCGSRDVAASHSHTAVVAAETLRRHTRRLLLRQQETLRRHAQRSLSGSKDVAALHSQAAIAAAVALKRHVRGLRLRQQRCCGVTLGDRCSGSRDVAASHSQRHYDQSDTSEAYRGLGTEQPASCLSDGCSSPRLQCWDVSWPLKAWSILSAMTSRQCRGELVSAAYRVSHTPALCQAANHGDSQRCGALAVAVGTSHQLLHGAQYLRQWWSTPHQRQL